MAEKVIDHDACSEDAAKILTAISTLRQATAGEKARARDRRRELLKEWTAKEKAP